MTKIKIQQVRSRIGRPKDQKRTLYLGTGSEGNGYVQTYNKYEQPTSYIGSNREMDGVIVLNDRYGALGYSQSGKEWSLE